MLLIIINYHVLTLHLKVTYCKEPFSLVHMLREGAASTSQMVKSYRPSGPLLPELIPVSVA